MPAPTFTRPVQGVAPNQYVQNARDEAAINAVIASLWRDIIGASTEEQLQEVLDARDTAISSSASAASSSAAAGTASGRLIVGSFAELTGSKFTYDTPGAGEEQVAEGDVITWAGPYFAYEVLASGATDQDMTTAGGVKLQYISGGNLAGYLSDFESLNLDTGGTPVRTILGGVYGKLIGVTGAGSLRESIDGVNWSGIIVNAASVPMSITVALGAIHELGDGEVLIHASGGSQLWKSSGWQANPSTATWAKVAQVENPAIERFHQGWGVRVAGQYVYACEYSGNDKPGAYNGYLSTNNGSTFTRVWNARDNLTLDGGTNFHNHGCAIDPWHGAVPRLWQINGDTPPQAVWYSDDLGVNWTKLPDSAYPTFTDSANGFFPGVHLVATATPGGIVIGMDDKPEGDVVIPRDANYTSNPRIVYTVRFPQDDASMSYVAQAQARMGDWVFTLHNPSGSVGGRTSAKITASNAGKQTGYIVWEDLSLSLVNLRKIDLWNGALWVRDNDNLQMLRIPLFQSENPRQDRPVFDGGNVLGGNVSAKIASAVALSRGSTARHEDTIVAGFDTSTPGSRSITIGHFFDTSQGDVVSSQSVVIANGINANFLEPGGFEGFVRARGDRIVALGFRPDVNGDNNIGIGDRVYARGTSSIAIGSDAREEHPTGNGVAIGRQALVQGQHSIALGNTSSATGDRSLAVGFGASATANDSTAVGRDAVAAHNASIAIGRESVTTGMNQIHIGNRFLQMGGFTSDRTTPPAGQVAFFFRSDIGELRVRFPNGTIKTIADDT